jgi:predicted  nucleic acid-binding Zn-ribbon protein
VAATDDNRLADLKAGIERAKQTRYKYEARIEELGRLQQRLLTQVREHGLEPADLDDEIARLQVEVEELLRQAAELLPPTNPGGQ